MDDLFAEKPDIFTKAKSYKPKIDPPNFNQRLLIEDCTEEQLLLKNAKALQIFILKGLLERNARKARENLNKDKEQAAIVVILAGATTRISI